jgi:glycosyltransferase involved in cell wall biosynthesis
MRIVVVTSAFPLVSETFVVRHAEALQADVFARQVDRGQLQKQGYTGGVWGPAGIGEASSNGLRARIRRYKNYLLDPARNFAFDAVAEKYWQAYLEERKPDVVLAEFAPNAMAVLPTCLKRGIPVVAHFHGLDASRLMRYASYRQALKGMFDQVAAVLCVSHTMRAILVHEGCPPSKLRVLPCGAPIEEFLPSQNVAKQPCDFLAVSRLAPGKGPMVVVRAFCEVLRQEPAVRLTVVGGGPLEEDVRKFVRENQCEHAVRLTGPLANAEVRKLMSDSASVFLQASHTAPDGWVEGWGVSIAEALASGLPAIVTRSGGMTDLVIDGYNGFLFEELDWLGMSEHMLNLARDPALRVRMGMAGRAHVERVGSTEKNVKSLASILTHISQGTL